MKILINYFQIQKQMQEVNYKKQHQKNSYNFLERIKPIYSIQKLLKTTASLNRFKFVKQNQIVNVKDKDFRQTIRNEKLPCIVEKINMNRHELNSMINRNHTKLNSSFSLYLQQEVNLCRDELRKKKITKLKKVEDQREIQVQIPKMQRQQSPFIQSIYKIMPLPNRCYDSIFPSIRYNPILFGYEKNPYLLGGYHKQDYQGLSLFHKYDFQARRWVQIKTLGDSPKLSPCFHTVQVYKNNMIIIGGVSFEGEKGKRFNTELLIFNFQKYEWQKARGSGINLKHHASTIFGSTIMINGGINQKQKFTEELYFITFSGGNLSNPLFFTVKNNAECHQKISRHKLVHTYELQNQIRNQIKYDGVFSFGGEDQQNNVNNTLMFINVLGKNNQNLDVKFKKWEVISTNEEKPCPRKDHSFNMINKKGIAILAGGIDQSGTWLDDIWILDIVRLQWIRINTYPRIQESFGTLTGHCACSIGTSIYFYNGNVQKKRDKAFWVLETDNNNYKPKKSAYMTKLPSFKSIASEKQNYSMPYF